MGEITRWLLPAFDLALLNALDEFGLLTIDQAVLLGVGDRKRVGRKLKEMVERRGWVGRIPARIGYPAVHWLNVRGAREAGLSEEAIARGHRRPRRDVAHIWQRVAIVDCQLALLSWAQRDSFTVKNFRAEYSRVPGRQERSPATTLAFQGESCAPDALLELQGPNGQPWLGVLELETGGTVRGLENFRRKLPALTYWVENFGVEHALAWPKAGRAARHLWVFADGPMLAKARAMAPEPQAALWRGVYWASLNELKANFGGCWSFLDGKEANPFPAQ